MEIRILNLDGIRIVFAPTYEPVPLEAELNAFCTELWARDYNKYCNSYLPRAIEMMRITEDEIQIPVGIARYSDVTGVMEAMRQQKPFAPRGMECFGTAIYVITSDDTLVLPRRGPNLKHAPHKYNPFAGWICSMNIAGREQAENPSLIRDSRLYDPHWQAVRELQEESGLTHSEAPIREDPFSLARADTISSGIQIGYIARTAYTSSEVRTQVLQQQEEFIPREVEHNEVATVPLTAIEQLIRNQPELQRTDPANFQPCTPAELILVEPIVGQILQFLEHITGTPRPDLVDHLGKGGIEVKTMPTVPGLYAI